MAQWSNFAPFGEFTFSGEPSESEKIYDAQTRALGPAFAGPNDDAETYADSMCFGAARLQIQAAGAQDDPMQVSYLIDDLEHDWRAYHSPGATLSERRAELTYRMAASDGALDTAITAGLSALLGSLFIHQRPMNLIPLLEVTPSAEFPPHSPLRATPIKKITINTMILPGTRSVPYTRDLDDGNPILIGDELVIAPGLFGLDEIVTVIASNASSFSAVFTKPHDNGTRAITGPYCRWSSNQRHTMVVVDSSVLTNSELLTRVHEFMRRTMPAVSTWIVCAETSPGYVGPWIIGGALISQTPIGVSDSESAILTESPIIIPS
jgi:hypothetical protein